MDSMFYKIIFKAIENVENENLIMSFKDLDSINPIAIPSEFIKKLRDLSEDLENIIHFQNIEEVLIIGNFVPKYNYNYYLINLFEKLNGEKQGYLIGNVNKLGDIIIGVWPFNQLLLELTPDVIINTFDEMIKSPNNYRKICIISQ
ncbi:hypothetical protein LCGC14_0385740 [marine sediment metagenome]|uniref:Uncharacterized protein n=1 Tax=marine sediment metagenome TaxID=412755 RepID=A0A0F9VN94_9ZZZZ|nr:MAG: hypothetical protein Lokiarch_33980 [Candidatus Lokiarchaeum sp. GC14_75]